MLNFIDNFLNRITMYRLILYYLIGLVAAAVVLAFFGALHFNPFAVLFSALLLVALCGLFNWIFSKTFSAPTNVESAYITALILALIIPPPASPTDLGFFNFVFWAAVWAMASKYLLAIRKKHVFNPAAFAVALTAFTLDQSASWWVGTAAMMPFVLIGGLLIVRKIRRGDLALGFFLAALAAIVGFGLSRGSSVSTTVTKALLDSPILFFAFVMITEPLTTPATRRLRVLYGAFVGFLFAPSIHVGSVYSTPELALLVGNIFSYLVSPKQKLILHLEQKIQVAEGTYDFVFKPDRKFSFTPGQYLEWTLGLADPDARGNRRYFTIASSPTEGDIRMGVKFYPKPSAFKQRLLDMQPGERIIASQLAGDFTLPRERNQKLVFIAGGIGVTPFRSMIKDLLDRQEKRPIVFFYSNKSAADIAYADIFDSAAEQLGIKTVYTLTDTANLPQDWPGKTGMIDARMIAEEVPDFRERMFYLSGPHAMVVNFDRVLKGMGVPAACIKKDFFPGFA